MTFAVVVFGVIALIGVTLDVIGRHVSRRCPTISDIASYIHRRRFGPWLLFAMWAAVGWHLLAS
jgi:hypothetical protein